jgi:hypothetical protein
MKKSPLYIVIGALVLIGVFLGWKMMQSDQESTTNTDITLTPPEAPNPLDLANKIEAVADIKDLPRNEQLAIWQQRYERAEQVYTSYKDHTRYPFDSRPIDEHPDQVKPFDPISETKVMKDSSGNPVKGLRLRTTQERVFASGNDTILFSIEAFDENNKPVPLTVNNSEARSVPEPNSTDPVVKLNLPFNDNGINGDVTANDGKYSARLAPLTQGFSNFAGTIRLLAEVTANGEKGVAHFDIIYTPEVPATWAGVRDVVENGSLNFYVKTQVKSPGRYFIIGIVYDGNGKPFAYLKGEDEAKVGTHEFKLNLFGALIRDKNPTFPLQLVDVYGFLLKMDVFPDRSMMPRQPGVVHTTGRYSADQFSASEWTSEERERYLKEYEKDLNEALEEINRLKSGS